MWWDWLKHKGLEEAVLGLAEAVVGLAEAHKG
jgi:hypothetical protein